MRQFLEHRFAFTHNKRVFQEKEGSVSHALPGAHDAHRIRRREGPEGYVFYSHAGPTDFCGHAACLPTSTPKGGRSASACPSSVTASEPKPGRQQRTTQVEFELTY